MNSVSTSREIKKSRSAESNRLDREFPHQSGKIQALLRERFALYFAKEQQPLGGILNRQGKPRLWNAYSAIPGRLDFLLYSFLRQGIRHSLDARHCGTCWEYKCKITVLEVRERCKEINCYRY